MIPYNRRQWAWDLKEMNYDWIAERVPMPRIEDVLLGALKPSNKKWGPNKEFWYPIEGGIEALPRAFLRYIPPEKVWLNATVVAIDGSKHEVTLADERRIRYGKLISTIPMPVLVHMLGDSVPAEVREAAAGLKYNIVHTVNIGLEGTELGIDRLMHWVYFPEETTIFHRISFPHAFSLWMVPEGCCSIQAEISESVYRPLNRSSLIRKTLDGLVRVGILRENEAQPVNQGGRVCMANVVTLDPAYIIYDFGHRQNTQIIKDSLKAFDIYTCGRFGEWEYLNMDHVILSGRSVAFAIREYLQ